METQDNLSVTSIKPASIAQVQQKAFAAKTQLRDSKKLTLDDLVPLLEILLDSKDLPTMQMVFQQLPEQAFNHPKLVSVFLRYLTNCGEIGKAHQFASQIMQSDPDISDPDVSRVIERLLTEIPPPETLQPPKVIDYQFDLADGHYSMTMLIRCSCCDHRYLEKTGWGVMILRPSFCTKCLEIRLLNPDFLVEVLKSYHATDGGRGFRPIDRQLNQLLARWHTSPDFPQEGFMKGIDLAEPMMLRILRTLVRRMYIEGYVAKQQRAS